MAKHVTTEAHGKVSNFFAIFYTAEYRKFQTVLIGIALAAATAGLLPAVVGTWVLLVVGVLTATGVYAVPNKTKVPEAETVEAVPFYAAGAKG